MLRRIKLALFFAVVLMGAVLGSIFAWENSQPASLLLLGIQLPQLSIGLWALVFLLIGSLTGLLLSRVTMFWGKQSLAAKNRRIRQLEKELDQLRITGLKG